MKHSKSMNHISWNVTKRCNLFCKHCYRESSPDEIIKDELTTEEGKSLLDQIRKAGLEIIVFSGGEPLMRPDIIELVQYAKSIGMTPLMGSNGTLVTDDLAKELKAAGLDAIAISIDSLDPDIHNDFRGAENALSRAMAGVNHCIDNGIKVQVNCTISKYNLDHIDSVMEYANATGASSCHMLFLVDVGRGKNIEATQLNKKEYKDTINRILDKKIDVRVKPTCAPQYKVEAMFKDIPSVGGRGCIGIPSRNPLLLNKNTGAFTSSKRVLNTTLAGMIRSVRSRLSPSRFCNCGMLNDWNKSKVIWRSFLYIR